MMTRYFSVEFTDLSYDMQQELIKEVSEALLEQWKEEAEKMMADTTKKWYVTPKTWQEMYCREHTVNSGMWNDLEEKSDEFQKYDWFSDIKEEAEKQAEQKLWRGFHHLEVEVEV